VPPHHELGLGRLEHALEVALATAPLRARLRDAQRTGKLPHDHDEALLEAAVDARVLTADEAQRLREALELREEVLRVDDYGARQYDRDRERVPDSTRDTIVDDNRPTWPH
jgi:acyl-CoA dehydrogenase